MPRVNWDETQNEWITIPDGEVNAGGPWLTNTEPLQGVFTATYQAPEAQEEQAATPTLPPPGENVDNGRAPPQPVPPRAARGFAMPDFLRRPPPIARAEVHETGPTDVVGKMLGKEKVKFLNKPSAELVLPDTHLGIEVEIEGVILRDLARTLPLKIQHYFEWHQDNSLHDNGCEFTYKEPMFGEDVCESMRAICQHSTEAKWRVSSRCGIHVHVDARDLTRHQLLGLIAYYIIYEPALFAWVGNDRHANNFCVPWFKYEGSLANAISILDYMRLLSAGEGVNTRDVIAVCDQFHKYSALNLRALATYGSIEFRHLQTLMDYDHILNWINMILGLKRAAMDVPESTMTIVHEISRFGVEAIGRRIFGEPVWMEMMRAEPNLLQEINEYSLPNAIEFIQAITAKPYIRINRDSLVWPTVKEAPSEKKDHPGFSAWRKANYPKDQSQQPEEPKSERQLILDQLTLSDILPGIQRPRQVEPGPELAVAAPTMASRGYALMRRDTPWVYLGQQHDTFRVNMGENRDNDDYIVNAGEEF